MIERCLNCAILRSSLSIRAVKLGGGALPLGFSHVERKLRLPLLATDDLLAADDFFATDSWGNSRNHPTPTVSQKSDLARSKKTLPVVLAAQSLCMTYALDAASVDLAFRGMAALTEEESVRCVRALREGILATWGIALLYRERARDCLRKLEENRTPLSQNLRYLLGFANN